LPTTTRPLTDTQSSWLNSMIKASGRWSPNSGYIWSNYSETVRLCEALVKKGLATKQGDAFVLVDDHPEVIARRERKAAHEKANRELMAERQRYNAEQSRLHHARAKATQTLLTRYTAEYEALILEALAEATD
jgi:hypothetical protein